MHIEIDTNSGMPLAEKEEQVEEHQLTLTSRRTKGKSGSCLSFFYLCRRFCGYDGALNCSLGWMAKRECWARDSKRNYPTNDSDEEKDDVDSCLVLFIKFIFTAFVRLSCLLLTSRLYCNTTRDRRKKTRLAPRRNSLTSSHRKTCSLSVLFLALANYSSIHFPCNINENEKIAPTVAVRRCVHELSLALSFFNRKYQKKKQKKKTRRKKRDAVSLVFLSRTRLSRPFVRHNDALELIGLLFFLLIFSSRRRSSPNMNRSNCRLLSVSSQTDDVGTALDRLIDRSLDG